MYNTNTKKERAVLIGTIPQKISRSETEKSVEELALLAESAGAEVMETYFQSIKQYDPAFFIGRGKAAVIAKNVKNSGIDSLIFDDDLSPAQLKNLERIIDKKIIDRTGLILEIFAQNARTREAKTQIELAQLQYLLPRLTRQWKHLERQVGGIGVRAGMGETQLEVDRRLVRTRIKKLKGDLKLIEEQRAVQKKRRGNIYKVTLVGYTNAGKSTLFNSLIPAHPDRNSVFVADRLFATLDSTVRRLDIDDHLAVLLSDTVGFIRKLPHNLIAAFRSTFDVVKDADLLLNIIDVSNEDFENQIDAVQNVLCEMEVESIRVLKVFNKIDLVKDKKLMLEIKSRYPDGVFVSASQGIGLRNVISIIAESAGKNFVTKNFTMPITESRNISRLFEYGKVVEQSYNGEYTTLKVRLSHENAVKLQKLNSN